MFSSVSAAMRRPVHVAMYAWASGTLQSPAALCNHPCIKQLATVTSTSASAAVTPACAFVGQPKRPLGATLWATCNSHRPSLGPWGTTACPNSMSYAYIRNMAASACHKRHSMQALCLVARLVCTTQDTNMWINRTEHCAQTVTNVYATRPRGHT
jgi:hypothetical protein